MSEISGYNQNKGSLPVESLKTAGPQTFEQYKNTHPSFFNGNNSKKPETEILDLETNSVADIVRNSKNKINITERFNKHITQLNEMSNQDNDITNWFSANQTMGEDGRFISYDKKISNSGNIEYYYNDRLVKKILPNGSVQLYEYGGSTTGHDTFVVSYNADGTTEKYGLDSKNIQPKRYDKIILKDGKELAIFGNDVITIKSENGNYVRNSSGNNKDGTIEKINNQYIIKDAQGRDIYQIDIDGTMTGKYYDQFNGNERHLLQNGDLVHYYKGDLTAEFINNGNNQIEYEYNIDGSLRTISFGETDMDFGSIKNKAKCSFNQEPVKNSDGSVTYYSKNNNSYVKVFPNQEMDIYYNGQILRHVTSIKK